MARLETLLAIGLLLTSTTLLAGEDPAPPKGQDLHGQDLQKRDLTNEDLEYADLSECNLFLANLKDGRLKGANLKGADLTSATLDGADLSEADLREAVLARASFQKANLSKANLEGLDLSEVSFQQAVLRGAILRKLKGISDITKADFREADLRGANLLGAVDYGGTTAKFKGAKYDKNTRWPKGFDVAGSGAVLAATYTDPAKAGTAKTVKPEQDEPAEEKVLDPNRPKDAPPEAIVKQLLEKQMWAPPAQGGTKHTYDYTLLKFGKPRKGEFLTDGVPANSDTTVYPVKVAVTIEKEYKDGTTKTEDKKQSYVFFKDEFDDWTFRFKGNE